MCFQRPLPRPNLGSSLFMRIAFQIYPSPTLHNVKFPQGTFSMYNAGSLLLPKDHPGFRMIPSNRVR